MDESTRTNAYHHFGVRIDSINEADVRTILQKSLSDTTGEAVVVFTPNPEILVHAYANPSYAKLLNESTISLPDGQGLIYMSGGKLAQRITGADITQELLLLADATNGHVGIVLKRNGLASTQEVADALNEMYSHLRISCIYDDEAFAESPDCVIVTIGFPKQEEWIMQNRNVYTTTRIFMAAGASIDFIINKQKRAPSFFRKNGLEWLWRLALQPKRIMRIIRAVIVFPTLTLLDRMLKRY